MCPIQGQEEACSLSEKLADTQQQLAQVKAALEQTRAHLAAHKRVAVEVGGGGGAWMTGLRVACLAVCRTPFPHLLSPFLIPPCSKADTRTGCSSG